MGYTTQWTHPRYTVSLSLTLCVGRSFHSYECALVNERYNPGLSFKTTEDLTNVLPGKILQLKSQKGRCQKVCDFEKLSITVFQI